MTSLPTPSQTKEEELHPRIPRGKKHEFDIDWTSIGHVPTCDPITVSLRAVFISVHSCPREGGREAERPMGTKQLLISEMMF